MNGHHFRSADILYIAYSFPNDEVEMERLDMAHAMMVRAIGSKLWLAPLAKDKVHRILDIGTGTGICMSPQVQLISRAMHY